MREEIPIITLLKELKEILPIENEMPKICCITFEDNSSCMELVKHTKMRPRTKHIWFKYSYFRSKVREDMITVKYINTKDQIADIFTNVLTESWLLYLRRMLNGHIIKYSIPWRSVGIYVFYTRPVKNSVYIVPEY